MSAPDQKVLIATLWHRTSERGNEYLSGFLGKARIVAFRGEPTLDGIPTWNLYLSPGKEHEEGASRASRPRAAPARREPAQQRPATDGEPFHSDPVDDIGRGES